MTAQSSGSSKTGVAAAGDGATPGPPQAPAGAGAAPPRSRVRRGLATGGALLGAVGLAAIYTRATLLHFTTGIVGGDIDGYENLWNHYWVKTALLDLHRSPFFTDYLYYPTGISLRFHALSAFDGLLAIPFDLMLGYLATTNLFFVLALVLTGFFSFLLIRDLTGHAGAAFAGAALFTYANHHLYLFYSTGQDNLLSGEWVPLYFFFLFRTLYGRPRWGPDGRPAGADLGRWPRWAALATLTLVVMSFTDWQYVMFSVFATLLLFAVLLATRRPWAEKGRIFGKLAAIGGVYALLLGPPMLLPMVQEALANPWLSVGYQSALHAADLLELVGPGAGNPGYVAIALAVLGLVAAFRRPRPEIALFWALAALAFYLISLGPALVVGGRPTGIPLPYGLLQNLPVFSIGRDPGRFEVIGRLGIGILAAFGLRAVLGWLQARLAGRRARGLAPLCALGVPAAVLVVSLSGFMATAGDVQIDPPDWPPFYAQLAQDPNTYAILELPSFTEKGRGEDHYQMYQALHHKLRFGGRWSRDHKLDNPNNFMKKGALFRQLWMLDMPAVRRDAAYPAQDFLRRTDYATQGLAILNAYQVRYLVLYKEALYPGWDEGAFQAIMGQVLGKAPTPYYEDTLMRVYRVPDGPPAANPLTLDVGDGWYTSEVGPDGGAYRWADTTPKKPGQPRQPGELYALNLRSQPVPATLRFTTFLFKQARTVQVALDGVPVTTLQLKPEDGPRQVVLDVTLPPSTRLPTTITFSSPDPPLSTGDPLDNRQLSFGLRDVSLEAK